VTEIERWECLTELARLVERWECLIEIKRWSV